MTMPTILEEITDRKRKDLEAVKEDRPARDLYLQVERIMQSDIHHSLPQALKESSTGIIAEFKRKSPSRGWIHREAKPEEVIPQYVTNGATALSILTDEPYFGGHNEYITRVRPDTHIPILRKDFIVDEYQLFEAKVLGADAILLIAACLDRQLCRNLARMARELNLDVLLEMHEERDLDYLDEHVSVAGVNNRDLHVFRTDLNTSFRLSSLIPDEFVRISESGIHQPEEARLLRADGFNGFLIGELFMKHEQPGKALNDFISRIVS